MQIAPIFSDNMVLQRDKDIPIWGSGRDGETIHITFRNVSRKTVVKNGTWQCFLPSLEAGLEGILSVSDGQTSVSFKNVITGDVWFAGGQSNMELVLKDCLNGPDEVEASAHPNIRFYKPVKQAFIDERFVEMEKSNGWQVCRPDTTTNLSAVAYFFAGWINNKIGIPIGVIDCNWGGTSISCWMSEKQLQKSAAGQRYIDDYAALVGGKSDEDYERDMAAYSAAWQAWDERVQARRAIEPDVTCEVLNTECGECPWPQPAGKRSPYRPTNLYYSMIRRVVPFALKGFLYYQGEEDAVLRYDDYAEMMYYLIDQWRTDWSDDEAPFLFVQLPMYASKGDVDAGLTDKGWAVLREQQFKVSKTIANTGMAVIIDKGEFDNIHPLDKQTVGFRLSLQALKKVYHKDVYADGPVFRKARNEGDAIRVFFDNASEGFKVTGDLDGFEVAGDDHVYHKAKASIEGDTIVASCVDAPHPIHVRYAWIKFGPASLFGKNGLPTMPFRSCKEDL
ncbi:MAG: sialate O-acetylesterase [Treponema sp.]|jgi:sialate O-acetylesterase|nr:sialate O-acetylesterase [Treponema sp.]